RFIGACRLRHDLAISGDLGSEVRIGVGQGTRFGCLVVAEPAQGQTGGQIVTIGAHRLASNSSRSFFIPSLIRDLMVPSGTLRFSEISAWVRPWQKAMTIGVDCSGGRTFRAVTVRTDSARSMTVCSTWSPVSADERRPSARSRSCWD